MDMEETKKAVQPLIRTTPDHVSGTALLDESDISAKLALVVAMNGSNSYAFKFPWGISDELDERLKASGCEEGSEVWVELSGSMCKDNNNNERDE